MGSRTSIEWAHHTFNPWWGCVKVSEACRHCYAEGIARRFGDGHWGPNARRRFFGDSHWQKPLQWNATAARQCVRRRVFCASMADVCEALPSSHPDLQRMMRDRARLRALIEETDNLDWLLLTKRPEKAALLGFTHEWFRLRRNVWFGATVEDQPSASERVEHLVRIPAAVRFVSCEPLLGHVDLTRVVVAGSAYGHFDALRGGAWTDGPFGFVNHHDVHPIDWVIAGGESGAGARPSHPDWYRSLRDQCAEAGVPFFFKQWGSFVPAGQLNKRLIKSPARAALSGEDQAAVRLYRIGKKHTGRKLDGREHDDFPKQSRIIAA